MASNGDAANEVFAPVLQALATLQSNVPHTQKAKAHEYLEQFQKSPEAWTPTYTLLQSPTASTEAKLFAATTLKGKIIYDLHQLPRQQLNPIRDSLISTLAAYSAGPKPIRTQLCVCLANLAIQMLEWKNVLDLILSALGTDNKNIPCMLEFLHVLPEEVTEGRKINLTEDELSTRTMELLSDNSERVLDLLRTYAQSSREAAINPQLLECITSWMKEVAISDIVDSALIDIITNGLYQDGDAFDSAIECYSAIFKETRETHELKDTIDKMYPKVLGLRPEIAKAAAAEDAEKIKGLTRLFSEAGEAWVLLIARQPQQYRGLCEAVLECALRDTDREAVSLSFNFWYELKQYVTLDIYIEARAQLADIFSHLVDIMISHLKFPKPEDGDESDLFDGDREQEDKFRQFRHQMGDVLKDCCEVIGVTECLKKAYSQIEEWVRVYAPQAREGRIPEWQALEAPLFSMRAMGKMVPPDENIMLPQLIPLIVQIPDHDKVKFQAVMALARYTLWTAHHPDTLKPQFDFILASFQHSSNDVVTAAALALKFFCEDCTDLLKEYVAPLQQFYESVFDKLPLHSQEELTEGVAMVIGRQPREQIYPILKAYCDPLIERLKAKATSANDKASKTQVADQIGVISIFFEQIRPAQEEASQANPAIQYAQEVFPVLSQLISAFKSNTPIVERVCRTWRRMVLSYRSAFLPLLPALLEQLASGFEATREGCFLWAADAIVREFSDGAENVDEHTTQAIFAFAQQLTRSFLQALSETAPDDIPNLVEDFFRLQSDMLLYYPEATIASQYMHPSLLAASSGLTLLKEEPLLATLHFLRDFVAYGNERTVPQSSFDANGPVNPPPQLIQAVRQLLGLVGEDLTRRVMTGMMYTFPRDCVPDASGFMLAMFELTPRETAQWVNTTIGMLPAGSITPQEAQRLMNSINEKLAAGENRKIRTILGDFTNSYRRRNVAPREGLGRLEASKFRFNA